MSQTVEVKPSPKGVPGAVTDPTRVTAEELMFAGANGDQVNGYLARPAEPDPAGHAGMIVIQEAMGVNDHIRDMTDRFANLGYVALAIDLYTREGGPPEMEPEALMKRIFGMPDARVLGDLQGAVEHLSSRDDVSGKIGCIGFCMGGRYTLLFACSSDRLDAAVDCWGGFIDKSTPDARPPSAPRRRWSWRRSSPVRYWPRSARKIRTPRRSSPRSCASTPRRAAKRSKWMCMRGPGMPSSPTTAPPTAPSRPPGCGLRSCRSSRSNWARRSCAGGPARWETSCFVCFITGS
jgi:dienelactone hydrolase